MSEVHLPVSIQHLSGNTSKNRSLSARTASTVVQYGFSLKVSVLSSPSHFSHSCTRIDSDCQKPDSWPIVAPVRVTQSLGGKQLPSATPLITLQGLPGPGGASVCQETLQPQPSTTSLSLLYLIHGGTEAGSSLWGRSFANPSSKSKNTRLDSHTWISWKTKKHHHMPTWRQQLEFFFQNVLRQQKSYSFY